MLRLIGSLTILTALCAGCASPLTRADLERGAVRGIVIDRIPAINAEGNGAAWYIEVETPERTVQRIAVTYEAFQAVDMSDILPDDLNVPLPALDRERTPWP